MIPDARVEARNPASSVAAAGFSGRVAAATRGIIRGALLLLFIGCAVMDFFVTILLRGSMRNPRARAVWLHRWCRAGRWLVNLRVEVHGPVPHAGLLVCNHLSYIDVIAISALTPCVFVAKREVAGWPAFGVMAQLAGTLFVDRTRKADAARVARKMQELIADGVLLVFFPEATSTDGLSVRPFKSGLFEPVARMHCALTAGALQYSLAGGSAIDEVCWWGDATLVPHVANLFCKPEIGLVIFFSDPVQASGDRKQIARRMHAEVAALRDRAAAS